MAMKRIHKGVILDVERARFDAGGATFATIFYENARREYLMFYTGSLDVKWSKACIGLATSHDGVIFHKVSEPVLNPEDFNYKEAVTPLVFRVKNRFYLVFAGRPYGKGRRICLAYSDDIKGPFTFIRTLIDPKYLWEGTSLDLGPSIVKLSEDEILVYYSNVSNKFYEPIFKPEYWFTRKFWLRRIGVLKLKIESPQNVEVYRLDSLHHLNGPKGSWRESLFCPGYFSLEDRHYLLPAASTYSVGYPYKQYIGLVVDSSPFFREPKSLIVLIDGPKEKGQIIPGIRSEIALDTPCPIIVGDKLYLYYAVMDRADKLWRTALTIFPLYEFYE